MAIPWQARQQAGFTLIEMMVVIAIIGIIAAMAYPSMQKQIINAQLKDAVNNVESAMKQARADALIYRTDVVFSTTGSTITLSQTGNNSYPQTKKLNDKIKLSDITLTFKPTKTVTNTPANINVCYLGETTDKYIVNVDTLANVNILKNGTC